LKGTNGFVIGQSDNRRDGGQNIFQASRGGEGGAEEGASRRNEEGGGVERYLTPLQSTAPISHIGATNEEGTPKSNRRAQPQWGLLRRKESRWRGK